MMKRERDESLDREPELTNGIKIQKTAQASDRISEDDRRALSQEPSGGIPAKRSQRQQSSGLRMEDARTELYKEGRKIKILRLLEEGESYRMMVRVPVDYLQHTNRQVKARTLWGSDVYTHDSDLVAVLMHCGFVNNIAGIPRNTVAEAQVMLEFLPSAKFYPSVFRNGIRSRAWGNYENGSSFKVINCILISRVGSEIALQPCPNGEGSVVPTFTPAQFERTISTRATASSIERRQKSLHEVTVQFNISNEPWSKYSMQGVADRGLKPAQLTSARLHREVLFMETYSERYELSREGRPATGDLQEGDKEELYRFSRCKSALPMIKMRKLGLPLPASEVEILGSSLAWEAIQFSAAGVSLHGKLFPILRFHFTGCTQADPS